MCNLPEDLCKILKNGLPTTVSVRRTTFWSSMRISARLIHREKMSGIQFAFNNAFIILKVDGMSFNSL